MATSNFGFRRWLSSLAGALLLSATCVLGDGALAADVMSEPILASARLSQTSRAQRLGLNLPLYFIENQGQVDPRAAFYVQGRDKFVYFSAAGLTIVLHRPRRQVASSQISSPGRASDDSGGRSLARMALRLEFVGAKPNLLPSGQDPTSARISYFKGRPENWKSGLKTFTRLVYADLWPGIDLIFSGTSNQLKYLFVVKPGADPAAIKLRYRGVSSVGISREGRLEVRTPLGDFQDDKPNAYQEASGKIADVGVAYDLWPNTADDSFQYGFQVSDYDPSLPLIIDPAILIYAGFIGGSGDDRGNAIAVDSDGNAYITGETNSLESSFPELVGPDRSFNGTVDAFVAKVNAAGTALVYAGYIGGSGDDRGKAIAVDGAGNAYITGNTTSNELSFPVTVGPDLTQNGATDAFVAKVNAAGTSLSYAGFIGGTGSDQGNAIAVDSSDRAYVAGSTNSPGFSFPGGAGFGSLPSFDALENGGIDGFVVRVAGDGASLEYATYLGGAADDRVFGIAVDGAGAAYLTGESNSTESSFPVTEGPDLVHNGAVDAFVAKVTPTGTALSYAGFIGGFGDDRGRGIAIVPGCALACEAYVAGETTSTESSFPVVVGPDSTHNGGIDAFVAKLNGLGTTLVYAGFIGGAGTDRANGIAVDSAGIAHVVGETDSEEISFPDGNGFGPLPSSDETFNGAIDGFVAGINASGTALVYASYLGGVGNDRGKGIAVDNRGDVYVAGETDSNSASFPTGSGIGTLATFDSVQNGAVDAFAVKICVTVCSDLRVTQVDSPDPVRVGDNVAYTITISNNGPDDATGVILTDVLPATTMLVSATPSSGTCSGTTTVSCALGSLASGASATVIIIAATTAKGTLNNLASVVADQTETYAADNQDNERTVATLANLTVRSLTAPGAALPGATITLQDTTRNSGTVDASAPTVTRFYLSSDKKKDPGDTILDARTVPPLAAKQSSNGSTLVTIPGGTALGTYFIIAVADDNAAVVETNERNQKKRKISVTRPDLRVSSLRAPSTVTAGASVVIQDTTRNDDRVDAGASVTKFYLSTDNVLEGGDVFLGSRAAPVLEARATSKASTTVTIPLATAPGRYFLIGAADGDAVVVESDEGNNARSRSITVK